MKKLAISLCKVFLVIGLVFIPLTAQATCIEVNSGTFAWTGEPGYEGGGGGEFYEALEERPLSSIESYSFVSLNSHQQF